METLDPQLRYLTAQLMPLTVLVFSTSRMTWTTSLPALILTLLIYKPRALGSISKTLPVQSFCDFRCVDCFISNPILMESPCMELTFLTPSLLFLSLKLLEDRLKRYGVYIQFTFFLKKKFKLT